jgi:alkyldihydroxyacetonephosphate synthase
MTQLVTSAVVGALERALSPERVSLRQVDRLAYARDMWPRTLIALQHNEIAQAPPDLVVWPQTTREVAEVVRIAVEHNVPLVPWGAGSGVCGGAMALSGGIIVDLKRMAALLSINECDHLVRVQAGVLGQVLEDQLNLRGLTLGHFPSSINCSTLGGWLATRSAGQCSSRYGKIEDMVEEIVAVTGDGRVVVVAADDYPNILQVLVGSEGTFGIITEATMRLRMLPSHRSFRGYMFERASAGCEAMRRVMQRELRPAVLRLYDELDTLVNGYASHGQQSSQNPWSVKSMLKNLSKRATEQQGPLLRRMLAHGQLVNRVVGLLPRVQSGCLLVVGFEGSAEQVTAEGAAAHGEILAAGGRDLGEKPGLRWFERRHAVSYKQSPLFSSGGFVDTMEVACSWSQLLQLYEQVRRAIAPHAVVMAHFSHAYPEGCSIYFTFAASAQNRNNAERLYDDIWQRGLSAALRAGGTISHHHGVGASKAKYMADEHGNGMDVIRRLKRTFDAASVLNPGKLGL